MTSNAPLRGGKSSLYEGGVRVPLVFVWPDHIPADTRTEAIFSTVDFYPTLLSALKVVPPPDTKFDGLDQTPVLLGKEPVTERTFCFFPHYDRDNNAPGASVRQGDWKLVRRFFGNLDHNKEQFDAYELYNLRKDVGETHDLATEHPENVRELDATLIRYLQDTGAVLPVKNPKYNPEAPEPGHEQR